MRKLLLSIAFFTSGLASFAQTVPLTRNWYIAPVAATAVTTTNSTIAYNKGTGKLYVADRNNKIYIVDPSNGSWSAANLINTTTVGSESYKYTKIRVADDGAIYAISMGTVSAGVAKLVVYKWSSETDAIPTRSEINVTKRVGESLAVLGTGVNTVLYVSGATNNEIYKLTTVDGESFTLSQTITLGANNQAWGSISPISSTEFIINGPQSVGIRKITIDNTGTITNTTLIPAPIEPVYSNAEYFEDGAKKYLALSGTVVGSAAPSTNTAARIRIYDITTITSPVLVSSAEMFATLPVTNSNPSGYADVAVLKNGDGTTTFFHVVHGSGLASYTTTGTLPVTLRDFSAALVKGQSTLSWQTVSETKNKGFEVWRANDDMKFSAIGFVDSKAQNGHSSEVLNYSFIDRTAKVGENYYKLKQVDLDGAEQQFGKIVNVKLSFDDQSIVAFPNPTTKYVTVNAGSTDYSAVKYELFDLSGKKVLSEKAKAIQQEISLNGLPSSIYYLRISKNNELQKTVKLIKQ
ncbi:T9SS type A sorting domain-containing protein [Pedobacter nanyangensis]|uniref:T9SS type A sorting domain-containing protein n=1 Tax=Pedobacter nanyangensis TaxID=1562389 RepID=UPI000DE2FCC3|nr:T9SS type A sorting domain-containing protein [Pedobacter nanyangensis]